MKIAIHGINGKMGMAIADVIATKKNLSLVAASVRDKHPWQGKLLSAVAPLPLPVTITTDLEQLVQAADVVIDFTRPEATLKLLPLCQKYRKAMMIGTTGFDETQFAQLENTAAHIPIIWAANTSIGVNLLFEICKQVARALPADVWDIDIFEAHHNNKADAPSGTARQLGECIAQAQHTQLAERAIYPYTQKRQPGQIGFSVVRGGDIVGEHSVWFTQCGERIEITHRASDRRIFALGAITAAQWIYAKDAALYDMSQVVSG